MLLTLVIGVGFGMMLQRFLRSRRDLRGAQGVREDGVEGALARLVPAAGDLGVRRGLRRGRRRARAWVASVWCCSGSRLCGWAHTVTLGRFSLSKNAMTSASEWRRLKWVSTKRVAGWASTIGRSRLHTVWPDRSARSSLLVIEVCALGDDHRVVEEPRVVVEHAGMRVAEEREQRRAHLVVDRVAGLAPAGQQLAELGRCQRRPQLLELGQQRRGGATRSSTRRTGPCGGRRPPARCASRAGRPRTRRRRPCRAAACPSASARVERRGVVERERRLDERARGGHRRGRQVDVDPAGAGGQVREVGGVVGVRVGQQDRLRLPALGQPGVERAPQLGQVEERLVVRPRVAGERQPGTRYRPGLPLPERVAAVEPLGIPVHAQESTLLEPCTGLPWTSVPATPSRWCPGRAPRRVRCCSTGHRSCRRRSSSTVAGSSTPAATRNV